MRFGFVGSSYQSQAVNADAQKCMNWYPEIIESGEGKSRVALYPTPGLTLFFTNSTNDPVRGEVTLNNRMFVVIGTNLYEISSLGVGTTYAGLVNDGLPVSMVVGLNQILIASGGNGYVFNLNTLLLTQVNPALQIGPWSQVGYSDGFFIALLKDSDIFQISALLDASTWDLTQSTQVSLFPEDVVSMLVDHREIWLWGSQKSVVYANYGISPFPFLPIPGAFLEQGAIAKFGSVRLDNSIFWIGADERGSGVAWRAQGYNPQRISNHAVEYAWQNYSTISDAVAYGYQDSGHSFYVVNFPTVDKTWVYDASTGMWHERGFWNIGAGIFNAHKCWYHAYCFGNHLVGDHTKGNVYQMSTGFVSEAGVGVVQPNGDAIRRIRRAPHIANEQQWNFHHQLQVDFESGLGPQPPLQGSGGTATIITLRDSNLALWSVKVLDNGTLQTTAGSVSAFQTILLNDPGNTVSWQLGVTIGGLLTTTSVAFNAANPTQILMISISGATAYQLGVTTGGNLTTSKDLGILARDPLAMLRWSDDGGHAWSNEYTAGAGQTGEYKKRAMWRRLGRSRDRVYELSVTDPIPWRVVDAYLKVTPGDGA